MAATHSAYFEDNEYYVAGLTSIEEERIRHVLALITPVYQKVTLPTGQNALQCAKNVASVLGVLRIDLNSRMASLLFDLPEINQTTLEVIEPFLDKEVIELISGTRSLMRLGQLYFSHHTLPQTKSKEIIQQTAEQLETLRKMLLAMAFDMRAVLICLALRLVTLRFFAEVKRFDGNTLQYAQETFDLYTPLANRLGIWQIKWELEDLCFRFLEKEAYTQIARLLEEKRIEREAFIEKSIDRLQTEMKHVGIDAEIYGRPKHIYSIWKKMQSKELSFDELNDVRAFRIIVEDIKTCYAVLGIVHHIWTPVPEEFDDYISRPKPNGYQSLHTVVIAEDGRGFEVQIRTQDMHRFAEYGIAAHWRYKEEGHSEFAAEEYDKKIAWLRQLLAWKTDITTHVVNENIKTDQWIDQLKSTTLDDNIYVLTPQARIVELPKASTPIDFAYRLHTSIGHRCRGAKVDGVMVPLNTSLKNAQTVEIITAKENVDAGPSRDWLNPGYTASGKTRAKIRAWFNALDHQETLSKGRVLVEKTLQREGKTIINLEELAKKCGFETPDDLFINVGKEAFSLRQIEYALSDHPLTQPALTDEVLIGKSRSTEVVQGTKSGVLVVGTDGLLTSLAKCCKPAPPDVIVGFVTRGKGVSIHRAACKNFAEMRKKAPERVILTTWGETLKETVYPVDIFVLAQDRQGLLRDISEIFSREKINVIATSTQTTKGQAKMSFTVEIASTEQLKRALTILGEVVGVQEVKRQ